MAALLSTDFPIYSIGCISEDVFYVAGGGGKAKTGIPNAIVSHVTNVNLLSAFNSVRNNVQ